MAEKTLFNDGALFPVPWWRSKESFWRRGRNQFLKGLLELFSAIRVLTCYFWFFFMSVVFPKLNLIAATCESMGIGYCGDLPWKLKNEMAYFNKMTTTTQDANKQNAVIMGRKTWFSIPSKHRPLRHRINIVISRELKETPEGAQAIVHSLEEAVKLATSPPFKEKVEKMWVIGGSAIYKAAIDSPFCHRIYLTRVMAKFDCDVFFPDFDSDRFKVVTDQNVPTEIQEENGIQYRFEVYERLAGSY